MELSCLCSDFHNMTYEVPCAHKMKENVTEGFDIPKYYKKN